jgi:hypothetical protein
MRWIVPFLIALAPAATAAARADTSDRFGFILWSGEGNRSTSMFSGSGDDWRRVQALHAGGGPMLYVRDNGAAYVIRDAATLSRANAIMAPQQELGRRQGELGKQQGELGKQQGALGKEQGRIGRMMADSTPRQMHELGRQQAELGRRQGELGKQQGELGKRQGELGKEQGRLARLAQPQLRALVADAIRRGVAQRVD